MVQKLQSSEYLKRYDNMAAQEREEYEGRVGDWLSVDGQMLTKKGALFEASLQNVFQVSVGWNDAECKAFEDGAILLSALVGQADTKLPDLLYSISAKRSIKWMFELLWGVDAGHMEEKPVSQEPKEEPAEGTAEETQAVGEQAAGEKEGVRMQAGEAKESVYTMAAGGAASVSPDVKPTDTTQLNPENVQVSVELPVPVRPKHIDQYVHLLPQKTQEKAAQVKDLLRELDEAREKMRLLMDDKSAKDTDREAWAKKTTSIDSKVRNIYDELDSEWMKLVKSGRVTVDDLGNAHVAPETEAPAEEPAEQTSDQKARRRELRKWLTDTRRGNGNTREEYAKKWQENFKEYLTIEGDAAFEDAKLQEAAAHYGIDLNGLKG